MSKHDMVVTYTISIDRAGNVYNDTQTHGSSFAEVYKAFHSIKAEVDRQIAQRRNCPFNPAQPIDASITVTFSAPPSPPGAQTIYPGIVLDELDHAYRLEQEKVSRAEPQASAETSR